VNTHAPAGSVRQPNASERAEAVSR